jgi:predicted peroxiredoxin
MVEKRKLVFMVTHGPENPELATIPFVMATTALASEIDVVMGFVANGAFLAMRGMAERVSAPGFPPLKELMDFYAEAGGRLYLCGPCIGSRHIEAHELLENAEIVGAATFVSEYAAASNVVVY